MSPLLGLSDELLLIIIGHLDLPDIIHLSQSCQRFDRLLSDKSLSAQLEITWNLPVRYLPLINFFMSPYRAPVITKLTLNDVYWLPSEVIKDFVVSMTSLKELHVAGTELTWNHLSSVLSALSLSALSWSWDEELEALMKPACKKYANKEASLAEARAHLLPHSKKFQSLRSLLLHLPETSNVNPPFSLPFFLSLCSNLEEMRIFSWSSQKNKKNTNENLQQHPAFQFPKLHTVQFYFPNLQDNPWFQNFLLLVLRSLEYQPETRIRKLWIVNGTHGLQDDVPRLDLSHATAISYNLGKIEQGMGIPWCKELRHDANRDRLPPNVSFHDLLWRATKLMSLNYIASAFFQDSLNMTNHPHLRAIKLHGFPRIQALNPPIFANAPHLEKLSLSGTIASQELNGPPLLSQAVASCPEMTELELIGGIPPRRFMKSLKDIAQWSLLRKLTLNDLTLHNAGFLVDVGISCTKLESLRLSKVGGSGRHDHMQQLCSALTHCFSLRDFRYEEDNVGSTESLFNALEGCKKLERVSVIVLTNNHHANAEGVLSLMESCPMLSVLYVLVGSIPTSKCSALQNKLKTLYKEFRPALSIRIRNKVDCRPMPSIHHRQLVLNEPHVCAFTDFPPPELD